MDNGSGGSMTGSGGRGGGGDADLTKGVER